MGVSATADRRFRRPDVRPAGVRSLRRLSRRAIGIGVLAAILVGVVAYATRAVLTSSLLRVRQITVHGTSRLKADDVAALVVGLRQDNILAADLPRYRQQLLGSSWIENVTLRRQLPSSVAIEVTERVPMIVAHVGDRLYLVDRFGVIIDEDGPQYRDLDLPLVDGLVPAGGVAHGSVDAWHVALVERFLTALNAAPDLRSRVSQIDMTDPHDVTVLLEHDSTFVRLGEEHFVDRLRRYLTIVPALRARLADLEYVDVRFDSLYVMPRGRVSVASRPVRTP
jgi:cell division septal protein FtsQ